MRSNWFALRHFVARPRLFISIAIGVIAFLLLPESVRLVTRLLLSWNFGTLFCIVSVSVMMARAGHQKIRSDAARQDEGRYVTLALAFIAAVASLVAIVEQLGEVKDTAGLLKGFQIGLAATTIVTSWAFIHLMFAVHYAHEYFDEWGTQADGQAQLRGGLEIVGLKDYPDYLDFAYYSFTIGVANATADINVTSKRMRRITLVHAILAFFFNIALLGLTINIGAGLI